MAILRESSFLYYAPCIMMAAAAILPPSVMPRAMPSAFLLKAATDNGQQWLVFVLCASCACISRAHVSLLALSLAHYTKSDLEILGHPSQQRRGRRRSEVHMSPPTQRSWSLLMVSAFSQRAILDATRGVSLVISSLLLRSLSRHIAMAVLALVSRLGFRQVSRVAIRVPRSSLFFMMHVRCFLFNTPNVGRLSCRHREPCPVSRRQYHPVPQLSKKRSLR